MSSRTPGWRPLSPNWVVSLYGGRAAYPLHRGSYVLQMVGWRLVPTPIPGFELGHLIRNGQPVYRLGQTGSSQTSRHKNCTHRKTNMGTVKPMSSTGRPDVVDASLAFLHVDPDSNPGCNMFPSRRLKLPWANVEMVCSWYSTFRHKVTEVETPSATLQNLTYWTHKQQTSWPESASELYRKSDRCLSAKIVLIFADRGVSRS
jgi:hypothetical protein